MKSKSKLFIVFIVFAIILSVANIVIEKLFFENNIEEVALDSAVNKTTEREVFVKSFLSQSEQTLYSLRELNSFKKYLDNGEDKQLLENIFLSYAISQASFMQLRFIDKNGYEKIRIDRDKVKLEPYVISKEQLQNKADRYYFADSKTKTLEKVWFSPLDLNIEHGKVETPYRPTIRAMLPISKDGKFDGILIINYLVDDFIKQLTNVPLYDMIVCNENGFPLYHYKADKSWGYYANPQYTIASDFPNDYQKILQNKFLKSDTFVSKKFDVSIGGGMYMILQLKKSYIQDQKEQASEKHTVISLFTLMASFIVTFIIVRLFSDNILNIKKLTELNEELKLSQQRIEEEARQVEETYEELETSYQRVSEISKKYEFEKYKYKSILDFASDGIFIIAMDGKIIEFSKMAMSLLGYDENEMKGLFIYDFDVQHTKEEALETIRSVPKEPIVIETKHKRKDGLVYDASITAVKVNIDGVDYVYSSARDITKQKEIAQQILEQKIEFETIFKNSKDGMAILDLESNFINFNDAYLEMTGYKREELFSKSCIELTAPEDKERIINVLSTISKVEYIENFQKTCIVNSGRRILTNMSISLLPDKKRVLLSTKDVTALKLLEEQSKLASMGEMIGNIAHQWRQPLSIISTSSTGLILQQEYGLLNDEKLIEACNQINNNAQYLSKTIDDFRNFIKGDTSFVPVNVSLVVDETLSLLKAALSSHYIKLVLSLEDDLTINANKNELEQALINIINNAKDALVENVDEHDRTIFISTKAIDSESLELSICDNGGGIPANVIDRIFEPYFTTKHQSKGTGLGLSMTHKIITQRHHTILSVYNNEFEYDGKNYKGACFKIVFSQKETAK
ncbi:MAG: PAS domain S-box protein [Arcobacteraceae bacterium]|nr:PAS domain S-box protein [Arcobacteraceae bacterium]